MRDKFSIYYNIYKKKDIEKIWKDELTLFIFDTNVLLNLYKYDEKTRSDFISIIESVQDKIWMPFHVGLEYHRNRFKKIKERQDLINEVLKGFDKIKFKVNIEDPGISKFLSNTLQKKFFPEMYKKVEEFNKSTIQKFTKTEENAIEKICQLKSEFEEMVNNQVSIYEDNILREIERLFSKNRIGENIFNKQNLIDEIDREGEERFKNKIGPGFCDLEDKKGLVFSFNDLTYQNKFGDLYIFKQIIDHVKKSGIKNVIFISDDNKDDWVAKTSIQGKNFIFPRSELVEELILKANAEDFMIIQSNKFVEYTSKYQSVKIDKKTVETISEIQSSYFYNHLKEYNKNNSIQAFRENHEPFYSMHSNQYTGLPPQHLFIELKEQLGQLEHLLYFARLNNTDNIKNYIDNIRNVIFKCEIYYNDRIYLYKDIGVLLEYINSELFISNIDNSYFNDIFNVINNSNMILRELCLSDG